MLPQIIGAQEAFMSQLCWQIRRKWDRQRSLSAWHKNHPDIPDDIFDQLYAYAKNRCTAIAYFNQVGAIKTIAECMQWVKQP